MEYRYREMNGSEFTRMAQALRDGGRADAVWLCRSTLYEWGAGKTSHIHDVDMYLFVNRAWSIHRFDHEWFARAYCLLSNSIAVDAYLRQGYVGIPLRRAVLRRFGWALEAAVTPVMVITGVTLGNAKESNYAQGRLF